MGGADGYWLRIVRIFKLTTRSYRGRYENWTLSFAGLGTGKLKRDILGYTEIVALLVQNQEV